MTSIGGSFLTTPYTLYRGPGKRKGHVLDVPTGDESQAGATPPLFSIDYVCNILQCTAQPWREICLGLREVLWSQVCLLEQYFYEDSGAGF